MTLLRRAPREVYRVFSEEDFLSGAGLDEQEQALPTALDEPSRTPPRRLGRVAGVAMVAGAVAVVVVLLVLTRTAPRTRVQQGAVGGAAPAVMNGPRREPISTSPPPPASRRVLGQERPVVSPPPKPPAGARPAAAVPTSSASSAEGEHAGALGSQDGEFGFER